MLSRLRSKIKVRHLIGLVSLAVSIFFIIKVKMMEHSWKQQDSAPTTYVMPEKTSGNVVLNTGGISQTPRSITDAERRRRVKAWLVKFDDFNKRQDAAHDRLMAETDDALLLIKRFAGSLMNLVPDSARDKLESEVTKRAEAIGASPDKVKDFIEEGRTSESTVSIISKMKKYTETTDASRELQELSKEHFQLMDELSDILP